MVIMERLLIKCVFFCATGGCLHSKFIDFCIFFNDNQIIVFFACVY